MNKIEERRNLLKSDFPSLKHYQTDQMKGLPMPPIEKEIKPDEVIIELPDIDKTEIKKRDILECLRGRRSRRKLDKGVITLQELSYLLYLTQGIQRLFKRDKGYEVAIRTVPSAGARHPFETYVIVRDIEGLEPGIYRYKPVNHKLVHQKSLQYTKEELIEAVNGQEFIGEANCVFVWSAIPYRTEWRYATASAKCILIDVGHICQNLYIASESLGFGTCSVGSYHQEKLDKLLALDGVEEMVVYLAPVGVV